MSAMVTFDGVRVPEADVLKAAAEIQQRTKPKAVEPGLYRLRDAPDADPFDSGGLLRRKNADGSWSMAAEWGVWNPCVDCDADVRNGCRVPLQPVEGVEYEGGDGYRRRWCQGRWQRLSAFYGWLESDRGADYWRTGQLRPAQSKPWTPKEGEWIQHKTKPWSKARMTNSVFSGLVFVTESRCLYSYVIDELRPATSEEIDAVKRIEPVDRLIVRCKADGGVWRRDRQMWLRLDEFLWLEAKLPNLDLDHYDILDEYTVQGAQR